MQIYNKRRKYEKFSTKIFFITLIFRNFASLKIMAQEQIQEQKLTQQQKLTQNITQQQLLQAQLTELPITQLLERINMEMDDNPALEPSDDDVQDPLYAQDPQPADNNDDYEQ